jgi:hypothetical protein
MIHICKFCCGLTLHSLHINITLQHMYQIRNIVTCYCEVSLAMWHQGCVTQPCKYIGCYFHGTVSSSTTLLLMQQCTCHKTFLEVQVVYSGLIRQSIIGARVDWFSVFLLDDSPVGHVNCEGARGRLYTEVLFCMLREQKI